VGTLRGWLLIAGCFAVTSVVYWAIHLKSRTSANPQAIAELRSGLACQEWCLTEPEQSCSPLPALFLFISVIYQKRNARLVENCKLFLVAPWTGMAPTEPEL
jgi:hypothetical protein